MASKVLSIDSQTFFDENCSSVNWF